MRKKILIGLAVLLLVLAGGGLAAYLKLREKPSDRLETTVTGVTLVEGTTTAPVVTHPTTTPHKPKPRPKPKPHRPKPKPRHRTDRFLPADEPGRLEFGGNPSRSLARPAIHLGLPTKPIWSRAMGSYMEYPPSYCNGVLYVNTYKGFTSAINAHNGKLVWRRHIGGFLPSTPAIAGPRLLVSSIAGTETALNRASGPPRRARRGGAKARAAAPPRRTPAYFGAPDVRLCPGDARRGHVRWASQAGGRTNGARSIPGAKV